MLDFKSAAMTLRGSSMLTVVCTMTWSLTKVQPARGIIELRNIDPRTIKACARNARSIHNETGARLTDVVDEYFLYNQKEFVTLVVSEQSQEQHNPRANSRLEGSCGYINSGIFQNGWCSSSFTLHKAIRVQSATHD